MNLDAYTAYIIYTYLREKERHTPKGPVKLKIYRAQYYNCFGRNFWNTEVFTEPGETLQTGKRIDRRSLQATAAGCCPPALMKEFIETEQYDARRPDAVEEAIKLHKRGYLGGGG